MAYFKPQHHPLVPRTFIDDNASHLSSFLTASEDDSNILTPRSDSMRMSDREWVIFSPRISSAMTEEDFQSIVDHENGLEESDAPGAQTPLAFPTHNGSGNFFSTDPMNMVDRINAWRVDQSALMVHELHRLLGDVSDNQLDQQQQYYQGENQDSETSKHQNMWSKLRKKVLEDVVGINDEVMTLLFGQVDWSALEDAEKSSRTAHYDPPQHDVHFRNSLSHGPSNWDSELVSKVFNRLESTPSLQNTGLLRFIATSILAHNWKQHSDMGKNSGLRTAVPSPTRSLFWNEGSYSSSNYWETSSMNSTPVW